MRLDEVHGWTSTDKSGAEGIAFIELAGGTRVPLIAPNQGQGDAMRPLAEKLAKVTGCRMTRVTWSVRTEGETIEP